MATLAWGTTSGATTVMPWKDNCLLDGCRIVNEGQADDDIVLNYAWPLDRTSAHTYLPLDGDLTNEGTAADWTIGGSYPVDFSNNGWLGPQSLILPDTGNNWTRLIYADSICPFHTTGRAWREVWLCLDDIQTSDYYVRFTRDYDNGWATLEFRYKSAAEMYINLVSRMQDPSTGNTLTVQLSYVTAIPSGWHHYAAEFDGQQGAAWLYIDGEPVASTTWDSAYSDFLTSGLYEDVQMRSAGLWGLADAYRVDNFTGYHGTSFSPRRYERGTVTAQYTLSAPQRLTDIDWSATTGPSYGQVTKVEVYSGGWRTVAEDPAGLTPPISGLDYTVAGPDIVRVTLSPKDDAPQSETPVLDWLMVNLVPVEEVPSRRIISAQSRPVVLGCRQGAKLRTDMPTVRINTRSV